MPYLLTSNPPGSPTSWVKMETDSVLSGNSEFSGATNGGGAKPQGGPSSSSQHHQRPGMMPPPLPNLSGKYSHYVNTTGVASSTSLLPNGSSSHHHHHNNYSPPHIYNSRSIAALNNGGGALMSPNLGGPMSHYSLQRNFRLMNLNSNDPRANSVLSNSHANYQHIESPYGATVSMPIHETLRSGRKTHQERVEVQITPQVKYLYMYTYETCSLSRAHPPENHRPTLFCS